MVKVFIGNICMFVRANVLFFCPASLTVEKEKIQVKYKESKLVLEIMLTAQH